MSGETSRKNGPEEGLQVGRGTGPLFTLRWGWRPNRQKKEAGETAVKSAGWQARTIQGLAGDSRLGLERDEETERNFKQGTELV